MNYNRTFKNGNGNGNNNKTRSRKKMGGEALASGGFGCIFNPAIKCKNSKERTNGVSKMSISEYGIQEINEINKISKILKKVPRYDKYYLVDIEMCKPDQLTDNDMINFDDKCFALTRHNITKENVNKKLDKLTILNMPNAGLDLRDWLVVDEKISREKIVLLNKIIAKLIKHGIRPMNEKGVIHNDLKDRNVMIDSELNTRIIDWGLAGITENNKTPKEILDRPLQYNTPFSSMVLSNDFNLNYEVFLDNVKKGTIVFDHANVRNYVINEYLIKLARYYGYYDDNIKLFNKIFSPSISEETYLSEVKRDDLIEYGYYLYYLSNYIADILIKYTKNHKFDKHEYYSKAYLYNSDIFGIMTVYYNFFELDLSSIGLTDDEKKIYLNHVRSILINYVYTNGSEKINVNDLCREILKLNDLITNNKKYTIKTYASSPKGVHDLHSKSKTRSKTRSKSKSKSRSKSKSKTRSKSKSKTRSKSK